MTVKKFEDLIIWQLGRELAKDIYELTKQNDCWKEDFRFRDQIRSSSGSIPDNIAEGFGREGNKEFVNFLSIARGSCAECQSQLYRAFDRAYMDETVFNAFLARTTTLSVKIHNTITSVKDSEIKGIKFKTT